MKHMGFFELPLRVICTFSKKKKCAWFQYDIPRLSNRWNSMRLEMEVKICNFVHNEIIKQRGAKFN